MPAVLNPIQRARPAQVSDRQLAQLRRVAHDVPSSLATEAECEWLLAAIPALLDELAARRAWMDGHAQGVDVSNIIPLPGVR
jgi:hypothetical protein